MFKYSNINQLIISLKKYIQVLELILVLLTIVFTLSLLQQFMIFDWSGLKDHRYFILIQKPDPLKYCNYALPIPSPIGLPFMPCDLPNEYELISTDQSYEETGDVSLMQRFCLPASHRSWIITGFDYYQHTPYEGLRGNNFCFSIDDRPTVHVKYQEKYIGKIVQKTIFNCCCYTEIYQQFEVYNYTGDIIYKVVSKNPQRGHLLILPWWGFDRIHYQIVKIAPRQVSTMHQTNLAQVQRLMENGVVGEIVHLFNGLSEFTSKNDKYGITFPLDAGQEEKCLLLYCTLLIDYLLFKNF